MIILQVLFAVLLLLTMVYSEFYCVICAVPRKNNLSCSYIGSAIDIGFFSVINIEYRKNIKNDIGIPLLGRCHG